MCKTAAAALVVECVWRAVRGAQTSGHLAPDQLAGRDGGHKSSSVKFALLRQNWAFSSSAQWFGGELGCRATRWTRRVRATGRPAAEVTPAMDTATTGEWASSEKSVFHIFQYLTFCIWSHYAMTPVIHMWHSGMMMMGTATTDDRESSLQKVQTWLGNWT